MPETIQTQTTQKVTSVPRVVTEHPQSVYTKKKVIFRNYQVVWYILGVIEVLLAFRIVLKMLGANPLSGFVSFVYTLSAPFATPFLTMFRVNVVNGSVFEWSTFVAMLVYALVACGVVQLFQLIKPTTPEEVEHVVDSQYSSLLLTKPSRHLTLISHGLPSRMDQS